MIELPGIQFNTKKKNEFFSSDEESSEEEKSNSNNEASQEKSDNSEDDALSLNESQKGTKDQKIYALKNINFTVKEGEFVCIIGEVGSGKSSLIQALLNNMIQINKEESNIIVNGSISYVPQEAWIQNDTLRNNILFYLPFEAHRYQHILEICELQPDLEALIGGDMTEIGEKGINLSGGQRARINIARALYNNKDIYIFDDPLSALDANVGKNIIRNCLVNFLEGKTRILITHALQHVYYADRIYYMKKGKIVWEGDYRSLQKQEFFSSFQQKVNRNVKRRKTVITLNDIKIKRTKSFEFKDSGNVKRLTKDEKKEVGIIKSNSYVFFLYRRFSYLCAISYCFMHLAKFKNIFRYLVRILE